MSDKLVLVVEDDFTNQLLMERMLNKLGLNSEKAYNGREAVEMFKLKPYSMIIMDIGLPVMNGIDATKEIRQEEIVTGGHIPIIALTAHVYQEDKKKCMEAGMDDYLPKPINSNNFNKILAKYI